MWRPDEWKCKYLGKKANRYFELGADAMLKKVYEWGDEECIEHGFRLELESEEDDSLGIVYPKRRECRRCWLELLKEVE